MCTSTLKPGKPLKQGKPLARKTPMSRGRGFATPAVGAGLLHVAAVQAKGTFPRNRESKPAKLPKRMKSTRPKMTPIRASAQGQECTLRFPGICNRNPETTVWCHSNRLADGKGMSLKAPDEQGCYGCYDCHAWLDGGYAASGTSRESVDARFDAARAESQEILRAKGLVPALEANTCDDHEKTREAA
jgi:hypothetical protein